MINIAQWVGGKVVGGAPGQTGGSGMGTPSSSTPPQNGFDTKTGNYYENGKLISSPGGVTQGSDTGTYMGQPISSSDAAAKGLIDKPGEFAQKAVVSGISAKEIIKGSSKESASSNLAEFGYVSTKGIYDPIKAAEAVKQGNAIGWQVNDRYFGTLREANDYINQNAKRTSEQVQAPKWMPDLYPSLNVTKDLKKKFESTYEPYVTIEGTTVYRPRNQPSSVTVPRFGKMVPAKEDPATKFISENFEKGERYVSDRLMLHEILNPVINAVESYKPAKYTPTFSSFTGQEWKDLAIGGLKGIRDKPLTTAGNVALTILITKGIGALPEVAGITTGIGTGAIASRVNLVNALGIGLAGMYGIDVSTRYAAAPNKARFLGELTTTELIPFGVGGYLGTKDLRIKSSINDAIRILKSQKEPLKALYFDESGTLVKTKWQKEAGKPEKKEVAQPRQETKQGTDVFNYFKGRTPAQPLSGVGKGGLGEFKSPADRLLEQITPTGGGRESYLEYQKRVVAGIFEKRNGESSIAYKKMIPKAKDILKATTTKKGNIDTLNKLWEDRRIIAASKEVGAKTKEGQIVLTKQKIVQLTKQEVKTAEITKERVKTIQLAKEDIKVVEQPKNRVYTLAYVSAASRLMNRLKENTLIANAVISKERIRTKPQTFTSETAKAIERIKEITKTKASERTRLAEKEQVREKVKEKTQEKQRTRTIEATKMRVPERLVKLGLPKFASEIDRISKKRKNRGKYVWDINNPVPTLKSVIG